MDSRLEVSYSNIDYCLMQIRVNNAMQCKFSCIVRQEYVLYHPKYVAGTLKEMWKYEQVRQDHKDSTYGVDGISREVDKTNLFRAQVLLLDKVVLLDSLFLLQRNVYIVGLTLFLALVIKRVLALILTLGNLRAQHSDLRKQVISLQTLKSGTRRFFSRLKLKMIRRITNSGSKQNSI